MINKVIDATINKMNGGLERKELLNKNKTNLSSVISTNSSKLSIKDQQIESKYIASVTLLNKHQKDSGFNGHLPPNGKIQPISPRQGPKMAPNTPTGSQNNTSSSVIGLSGLNINKNKPINRSNTPTSTVKGENKQSVSISVIGTQKAQNSPRFLPTAPKRQETKPKPSSQQSPKTQNTIGNGQEHSLSVTEEKLADTTQTPEPMSLKDKLLKQYALGNPAKNNRYFGGKTGPSKSKQMLNDSSKYVPSLRIRTEAAEPSGPISGRSPSNRSGKSSKSTGRGGIESALNRVVNKITKQSKQDDKGLSESRKLENLEKDKRVLSSEAKGALEKEPIQKAKIDSNNTSVLLKSIDNSLLRPDVDVETLILYESLFSQLIEADSSDFKQVQHVFNKLLNVSWHFDLSDLEVHFKNLKLRNNLKNLFLLEKLSTFVYCVRCFRDSTDAQSRSILLNSYKGFAFFIELLLEKFPSAFESSVELTRKLKEALVKRKASLGISTEDVVLDSYTTYKHICVVLVPMIQSQFRKGTQFLYNLNIFLKNFDQESYSEGMSHLLELLEVSEDFELTKETIEGFSEILFEEEKKPKEVDLPIPMPLDEDDQFKPTNLVSIRSTRHFEKEASESMRESIRMATHKDKSIGNSPGTFSHPENHELGLSQAPQLRLSFSPGTSSKEGDLFLSPLVEENQGKRLSRAESIENSGKLAENDHLSIFEEYKMGNYESIASNPSHLSKIKTQESIVSEAEAPNENERPHLMEEAKEQRANETQEPTVKDLIKEPFLPPLMSIQERTFTLVLDLDETLVHFEEVDDVGQFYIRPFAKEFLDELSQFYELVIFTAATKDVSIAQSIGDFWFSHGRIVCRLCFGSAGHRQLNHLQTLQTTHDPDSDDPHQRPVEARERPQQNDHCGQCR